MTDHGPGQGGGQEGSAYWPVSVKGVLFVRTDPSDAAGSVVLLRNERAEWELPGGRVELDDASLPVALQREFHEELDLVVSVGELLDTWIYEPLPGRRVLIVTYLCSLAEGHAAHRGELTHSHEHSAVGAFSDADLLDIALPAGYYASITRARRHYLDH